MTRTEKVLRAVVVAVLVASIITYGMIIIDIHKAMTP